MQFMRFYFSDNGIKLFMVIQENLINQLDIIIDMKIINTAWNWS